MLALLIVAFAEYRDSSFRTDEEIGRLCQLPVLAVVPVSVPPSERKSAQFRLWTFRAASFVVLVILAVAVMLWKPQV
jgi:hypothetical protein